jgi:hypothetical protein
MTATTERAHQVGTAFSTSAVAQIGAAKISAIKKTLSNLWPPTLIVLGLVLTLGWNVGLVWLLFELV